jgi:hypothetical protein
VFVINGQVEEFRGQSHYLIAMFCVSLIEIILLKRNRVKCKRYQQIIAVERSYSCQCELPQLAHRHHKDKVSAVLVSTVILHQQIS